MMPRIDIAGQRFERLRALKRAPNRGKYTYWICLCDCGNENEVRTDNLRNGSTKSCGCLWKDTMHTHGQKGSPEYYAWNALKQRCLNPNNPGYKYYGGRGISVCERWEKFENFFEDMGEKTSPDHSVDRTDNDGNYEPGNCRWATPTEQVRNQRPRKDSKSGVVGVRLSKSGKWCAGIGVDNKQIYLGTFDDFFEACCARKSAELRYWK